MNYKSVELPISLFSLNFTLQKLIESGVYGHVHISKIELDQFKTFNEKNHSIELFSFDVWIKSIFQKYHSELF